MSDDGFQKPRPRDHLKKDKPTKAKKVRLAIISQENGTVWCNCGWVADHERAKVREDKADRHLAKKHGGQGIRV